MLTSRFGLALALVVASSASFAQETAKARFIDTQGRQVGTATPTQTARGVLVDIDASGLPAGEHAFHVHQTGKCSAEDGFKSAGEHFAGKADAHGLHAERGPHAGDMPNQFVGSDGKLRAHVVNSRISLREGDGHLFDKDGSALVLHAKPDDYRSQPSGNAGDRIACAVVERGG